MALKIPGGNSNIANYVTAIADVEDISSMFNNDDIVVIEEVSNGELKSWVPGRTINALKTITAGNSYYIKTNVDLDVSEFFQVEGGGISGPLGGVKYKTRVALKLTDCALDPETDFVIFLPQLNFHQNRTVELPDPAEYDGLVAIFMPILDPGTDPDAGIFGTWSFNPGYYDGTYNNSNNLLTYGETYHLIAINGNWFRI